MYVGACSDHSQEYLHTELTLQKNAAQDFIKCRIS
jgi:hypothetical protein